MNLGAQAYLSQDPQSLTVPRQLPVGAGVDH